MTPEETRPPTCPPPGTNPGFDTGWNAHREGQPRDSLRGTQPPTLRHAALLGWDMRHQLTRALTETCEP